MVDSVVPELREFFQRRTDDHLRSIVRYDQTEFSVEHIRDDVADQYTDEQIARAVDDSRMESLSASIHEEILAPDHGDLTCLVKCFEHVVEMNFVVADGAGAAVALDIEAVAGTHSLMSDAREIVLRSEG